MSHRVLITDDDPVMCKMIEKILSKRDCSFMICHDAESTLSLLKRESFDVLVSDFMLPGISGVDMVSQIRNDLSLQKMPIIMVSAHNNYAMAQRCKSVGANAFLRKPFSPSQLLIAYDSCLRGDAHL